MSSQFELRTNRDLTKPIMNPLLTSLVRSVRKSIIPSVFIAETSLLRCSVCTKNVMQYFPVHASHSVNKFFLGVNKALHSRLTSVIAVVTVLLQ